MTDTISNWTLFGVHLTSIELYVYYSEENDCHFYNSSITISLDNGLTKEFEQVVTLFTDIWEEDPVLCAVDTALSVNNLFSLSRYVMIFNQDGSQMGEFFLPENFDDIENVDINWLSEGEDEEPISDIDMQQSTEILMI
jgi:hypothetical protein